MESVAPARAAQALAPAPKRPAGSRRQIDRGFWFVRLVVAATILTLAAILVPLAGRWAEDDARAFLVRSAVETLNVQAETLNGILDKYRLLPPLLARMGEIEALYARLRPADPQTARQQAELIAGLSGALDVALIEPDGSLIASARGRIADPRGQIAEALDASAQGRLGRASLVLGDGQRAYAFVFAVKRGAELLGHIAILVGFESVESTWALSTNPIYLSDTAGRVFLSNRADWRLADASALPPGSPALSSNGETIPYIDIERHLPLLDWRLHVLADERPAQAAAGRLIAALALLVVAAGLALLLRRREQAILRERRDRAIALKLERIVRDRTRALSLANQSLEAEIVERRATEDKLRKTQSELVHAAKLAGLGQMAAALSHEFNQPLAAIRTYADNADRFLARERPDMVSKNLGSIAKMTDRMAELSKTLLAFARKPGTSVGKVPLGLAVDEAMILVRPRLKKAGISLAIDPAIREIEVMGGRVRLSQVFVNLLNNAVDADGGRGKGHIAIRRGENEPDDGRIAIIVEDDGPGIPPDIARTIFEPFVTTKASGEGIGIGLSIVSNILADFGGAIRLEETRPGCTRFAIFLVRSDRASIAAE